MTWRRVSAAADLRYAVAAKPNTHGVVAAWQGRLLPGLAAKPCPQGVRTVPALDPGERRLQAQLAANTRWSKEDPTENAARARRGLDAKWLREVDPNNELPEAERQRRAKSLRTAYYQRLALASAKARRAKRGAA